MRLAFVILLLAFTQCKGVSKHQKVEAILTSGKVDTNDYNFIKENNLVRYYKYKYDTSLNLEIHYRDTNKRLAGYAFHYLGKAEGKWILYDVDGKTLGGEVNYHNGKMNGYFLIYKDSILHTKTLYMNDTPIYMIHYDSMGKLIDSTNVK